MGKYIKKGHVVSEENRKIISEKIKKIYMDHPEKFKNSIDNLRKLSRERIGKPLSEETRMKLSLANTGHHHSEESKRKISEAQKGISRGPRSEETKRKISLSNKGKIISLEARKKMSLAKLNYRMSEETKKKISIANRGKIRSDEAKRNMSSAQKGRIPWTKGKHHSIQTKLKISSSSRGKNHHNWKGGITPVSRMIRQSSKYKEWRQKIYVRDNFTCQKCGERGGELVTHHCKKLFSKLLEEALHNLPLLSLFEAAMIYDPLWDLTNGITWCLKCHKPRKGE